MSKTQTNSSSDTEAVFFERRRIRRIRMILDLTSNLIRRDASLSHRQARCLVDCARRAVIELNPSFEPRFESLIKPHFEQVLRRRWPSEELECGYDDQIVN